MSRSASPAPRRRAEPSDEVIQAARRATARQSRPEGDPWDRQRRSQAGPWGRVYWPVERTDTSGTDAQLDGRLLDPGWRSRLGALAGMRLPWAESRGPLPSGTLQLGAVIALSLGMVLTLPGSGPALWGIAALLALVGASLLVLVVARHHTEAVIAGTRVRREDALARCIAAWQESSGPLRRQVLGPFSVRLAELNSDLPSQNRLGRLLDPMILTWQCTDSASVRAAVVSLATDPPLSLAGVDEALHQLAQLQAQFGSASRAPR